MSVVFAFFISLSISLCIGIMLQAKIKISMIGAVLGGLCYGVYILSPSVQVGFFASTLILALLSEIFAKLFKTPSTLFLIIGVYPLVPGVGIYKTILYIIESDYAAALKMGGDTFVNLALMATAIALVSIVFGKSSEERFKRLRNYN